MDYADIEPILTILPDMAPILTNLPRMKIIVAEPDTKPQTYDIYSEKLKGHIQI